MNASVLGAQMAEVLGRLSRTPKLLTPSFSHPSIMHRITLVPSIPIGDREQFKGTGFVPWTYTQNSTPDSLG